MDYGHTLEFGSFINPTSSAPQQAVELARLAEDLGLDLVAFQDHPYVPGLLDVWTLMSYVAARTEQVRIVPDVLNLPLRPPAVLARAAVSLDLLSGGRFEVALGAGYYWDAIEAMGGRRLTPGQSVAALDEAIRVLHETWDTEASGGVYVDGSHYRINGAKRGPQAAHRIPIHVGGMKPRMLELTGRAADGWLVSQPAMTSQSLTEAGTLIDQAAVAAGRNPREIRRMLNVEPTEGRTAVDLAEELAALALDDGVSVFFLVSDDPDVMRGFATRTAPAVRELVSAHRGSPA
jgi:alkanesulfonate monooxygenase SsuD/methylene tetrahydromethanopterin reductase-like flavin-dependent oxidoreductase (luciferase family)